MHHKTIGSPNAVLRRRRRRMFLEFREEYASYVRGSLIMFVLLGFVGRGVRRFVYSSQYQITTLEIEHENMSMIEVYQNDIKQSVQKTIDEEGSYFLYRYGAWKRKKEDIKKEFPTIKEIKILTFENNTLNIHVKHYSPRIVRQLSAGKRFGSYGGYMYELSKGYKASEAALLYLPAYLKNIDNLDGIYHMVSEEKLAQTYHTVNAKIPLKHMIVYPGAGYVAMVTAEGLNVGFSLRKPIEDQMALYSDIYSTYPDAHRIVQIDVGSLDDAIVTLK